MAADRRHLTISWRGRRVDVELIEIDDDGHELELGAAQSWHRMRLAAEADGIKLEANTAFRDRAYQKDLRERWEKYSIYKRKLETWEANGMVGVEPEKMPRASPAARPGSSTHEVGNSVDVRDCNEETDANYIWMNRNAKKFGWVNDVKSEIWHWTFEFGVAVVA